MHVETYYDGEKFLSHIPYIAGKFVYISQWMTKLKHSTELSSLMVTLIFQPNRY